MLGIKRFLLLFSCGFVLTDIALESAEETAVSDGYSNLDLKMWWSYIKEAVAEALVKIGRRKNRLIVTDTVNKLRAMLNPGLFCPHTFYDITENVLAGQLKSVCGRLILGLKHRKNGRGLQTVYRLNIPLRFYLNVSFLAFKSHSGMDYPICDTSDVVLQGADMSESRLCGKPYQQSIFVQGAFLDVMSHYEFRRGDDSASDLVMLLEYQVIPPHLEFTGSSLNVLLQPMADIFIGNCYVPSSHQVAEMSFEECGPYHAVLLKPAQPSNTKSKSEIFTDFLLSVVEKTADAKDRWALSGVQHIDSLGFTHASQAKTFCGNVSSKWDTDEPTCINRHANYIWMPSKFLCSKPNSLKLMPRQKYNRKLQRIFTTFHIPWYGDRRKTVHIWAFYAFPFNDSGDLSLNTVSIYIPQQNCRERLSDWLTVLDGPHAGIMTPSGLQSPFPVLAGKSCTDLMPGETYNSSIGDITLVWYNQFMANASIFFLYSVFKLACPDQFCVMDTFLADLGRTDTVHLTISLRTSLHILNFSASHHQSNVKLRIWMRDDESFQSYISQCRTSGLFLVDKKLKAAFCSSKSFKVLNNTLSASGIQFGREALLIIKAYFNENFAFAVEYSGTNCFGMVNAALNMYNPVDIYPDQCVPVIHNYDPREICNNFPILILPHGSDYKTCCLELSDIASDLMTCPVPLTALTYKIVHWDYSAFEVIVNATRPADMDDCSSCKIAVTFADQPDMVDGNPMGRTLCKSLSKPVYTASTLLTFPKMYHTISNALHCSARLQVRNIPHSLKGFCVQFDIDQSYNDLVSVNTSKLSMRLEPVAICNQLTMFGISRTVSLSFSQAYLHDDKDFHSITEYDFSFHGGTSKNPIQLQLGWSSIRLTTSGDEPDCVWEMVMLIQNDSRLSVRDSVSGWLDSGISITLLTGSIQHEINVSYARKLPRQVVIESDEKIKEMLNNGEPDQRYCFLGKCYVGFGVDFENLSWVDAHKHCHTAGRNLVTINSETEWLALAEFLYEEIYMFNRDRCTSLAMVFIGLSNQDVSSIVVMWVNLI